MTTIKAVKKILGVLILLLFINKGYTQQYMLNEMYKQMKAADLILGTHDGQDAVLVKLIKNGKWGLYEYDSSWDISEYEFEEIIPAKYDSLSFFEDESEFQIVKLKDRYGVLMNPAYREDTPKKIKCNFDKIIVKKVANRDYILFKENDKWGLLDKNDEYVIVDPIFEHPDDVPLIWMEDWAAKDFRKVKETLNADIVKFDTNNGDGVKAVRNKETKKWGMYQYLGEEIDEMIELIPSKYDSLRFFPFNGMYTAVYNNGKVGFYLSYWSYDDKAKQSVECLYEDYKRYTADGVYKLAVKKNGKWGWINWLTGEEQSEFNYDTPDDLPYPYFKQNYYFDE